jgi:hypothetical protein
MARQIMLEGFMIRPIVHILDLDEASIEPLTFGEYKVKLSDLEGSDYTENQWPVQWEALKERFRDQVKVTPPRSARRATAKPRIAKKV